MVREAGVRSREKAHLGHRGESQVAPTVHVGRFHGRSEWTPVSRERRGPQETWPAPQVSPRNSVQVC